MERAKRGPSATPKTFKDVSSFGSSQAFILTLNNTVWRLLLVSRKMFSPYSVWHCNATRQKQQTGSVKGWVCVHLFTFFSPFLTIPSKCLLRFTYWDQVTKDAKKEAARYILYVYDWINTLLNECHCWARCKNPFSPFFKSPRPSQLFDLLYYLNGSLCISQAVISQPDFLWGSHFLSWIISMLPACPQ